MGGQGPDGRCADQCHHPGPLNLHPRVRPIDKKRCPRAMAATDAFEDVLDLANGDGQEGVTGLLAATLTYTD